MNDERTKILFSDLYRDQRIIKNGLKDAGKLTDQILVDADWAAMTKTANELWDEVDLIEKHAAHMRRLLEDFIGGGLYAGQAIGTTPMETLANE